jgi:hypothetical protein
MSHRMASGFCCPVLSDEGRTSFTVVLNWAAALKQ